MNDNVKDIIIPDLGEDVKEVTVVEWLKEVGEPISEGDVIFEVMTDKANMEIQSETAGVLAEIIHGKDTVTEVGAVVGRISMGA